MYQTKIEYNVETQLFDLFLDDEDVGSAFNYWEAHVTLKQLIAELESTGFQEAA